MKWTIKNQKMAQARPPVRQTRYLYSLLLDQELWKKAHQAALNENKHLSDVVRDLIAQYVAENESRTLST